MMRALGNPIHQDCLITSHRTKTGAMNKDSTELYNDRLPFEEKHQQLPITKVCFLPALASWGE